MGPITCFLYATTSLAGLPPSRIGSSERDHDTEWKISFEPITFLLSCATSLAGLPPSGIGSDTEWKISFESVVALNSQCSSRQELLILIFFLSIGHLQHIGMQLNLEGKTKESQPPVNHNLLSCLPNSAAFRCAAKGLLCSIDEDTMFEDVNSDESCASSSTDSSDSGTDEEDDGILTIPVIFFPYAFFPFLIPKQIIGQAKCPSFSPHLLLPPSPLPPNRLWTLKKTAIAI